MFLNILYDYLSSALFLFLFLFRTGASIPSFCFSNALGWRMNFGLQIIVILIRIALVIYIIWYLAVAFSDSELAAVRICQLATILLSTISQSPLFHMSFKSSWLINLRPIESNYAYRASNTPHGNRIYSEVRTRTYTTVHFVPRRMRFHFISTAILLVLMYHYLVLTYQTPYFSSFSLPYTHISCVYIYRLWRIAIS